MAELSDYEKLRIANILRNEAEMKRLGLDVSKLTNAALGRQAPTATTRRRAVRPKGAPPTRRSLRAMGKPAPAYSDAAVERDAREAEAADLALGGRGRKRARTAAAAGPRPPPATATSIRNLDADIDGLRRRFLGRVVPPLGGQVKRAVMEAASPGVSPTFSRMSGIQEWRNAIMLFVNVYGDGYKNSFVGGGVEITWFAQPRQWEGTPVVQRLVNCDGGEVAADGGGEAVHFDETPVLLFCREEGQGYVYCGELAYLGHDPARIPIRFVWQLTDYEQLKDAPPFQSLVANCRNLLASPRPLG